MLIPVWNSANHNLSKTLTQENDRQFELPSLLTTKSHVVIQIKYILLDVRFMLRGINPLMDFRK